MEIFTNEGISHIASGLGVPLFVDKATDLRNTLSFTRICVKIDQTVVFPSIVKWILKILGVLKVRVEYPWKPKFVQCAR